MCGQAVILRVRMVVLCVRTCKVTACPHSLTAMRTRNDLACPHVSVCGRAGSLRVRIVVLCVRTSRYLACPHCSPMYADTQKYCVSAYLYMRTRNDTACPHELRADRQRSCVSAHLTQCGHAMTLRVRMYQCADTQDHCVSAVCDLSVIILHHLCRMA